MLLEGRRDPLTFSFDHNGVTPFAEKIEGRKGEYRLVEPRLLNGAQTLSTLERFLEENRGSAALRGKLLAEMWVPCKLLTDAKAEFVMGVTLANNRQNPVKPWNLHANDLIQLELQDKFREDLGLYYERQEKAFESLDEEEREEREIQEGKALELLKTAQTFLASEGELERMFRLQELFEDEAEYARLFSRDRLQVDSRRIVLCYKIHFRLGRLIRSIVERGERKYFYLRRARNLLWALLCQAVQNRRTWRGCSSGTAAASPWRAATRSCSPDSLPTRCASPWRRPPKESPTRRGSPRSVTGSYAPRRSSTSAGRSRRSASDGSGSR